MALLTEMMTADEEFTTTVTWNGALTTVWITSNLTGVTAKGHARHNPEDAYDQGVGYQIARARAMTRLMRKVEKAYVRATK